MPVAEVKTHLTAYKREREKEREKQRVRIVESKGETIYSDGNREEEKTIERSRNRESDQLESQQQQQQQQQRAVGAPLCSLFTNKLAPRSCLAKETH